FTLCGIGMRFEFTGRPPKFAFSMCPLFQYDLEMPSSESFSHAPSNDSRPDVPAPARWLFESLKRNWTVILLALADEKPGLTTIRGTGTVSPDRLMTATFVAIRSSKDLT